MYYVYTYLDPRIEGPFTYGEYEFEYEPFYVGKGKEERYIDHILDIFNNPVPFKSRKDRRIRKIMEHGYNPLDYIDVLWEGTDEAEAYRQEQDAIAAIGRKTKGTGPLLNLTKGGLAFSDLINQKRRE